MEYQQTEEPFLYFATEALTARFPDGSSWSVTQQHHHYGDDEDLQVSVRTATPLGTELWITDADSEAVTSRTIRLIFWQDAAIQDWRKAARYGWKLDSAWISNPKSSSSDNNGSSDEEYDWWHWNVQSFIDSAIQVPESNEPNSLPYLWDCGGKVSFPFHPILSGTRTSPGAELVFQGLKIGFGRDMSQTSAHQLISPPGTDPETCVVVDGSVVTGSNLLLHSFQENKTQSQLSSISIFELIGGILLLGVSMVALLLGLKRRYQQRQRQATYQKLPLQTSTSDTVRSTLDTVVQRD